MIGSPLYQISAEHLAAVVALLALPIGLWLLRRGRTRRGRRPADHS